MDEDGAAPAPTRGPFPAIPGNELQVPECCLSFVMGTGCTTAQVCPGTLGAQW